MTIKVKICGITDLEQIKQIEKLNVDHIGFINIKRSKRYVSNEDIKCLKRKLNNNQLATLVLEPEDAYEVTRCIDATQIFNIQLHSLNKFDIRYIKWSNQYNDFGYVNTTKVIGLKDSINDAKINELKEYAPYADNILLDYIKDGLTGGTNTQIPIETAITASKIIKQENANAEVTLAGGLNYDYLESIYDKLHYFDRIDLNSGVEKSPGQKDIHEIKKVLNLVSEL